MSRVSFLTTFESGHPVVWTLNVSFIEDSIMDRKRYDEAEYEL